MSEYECLVPDSEWNLMRHTRQEQAEAGEVDRNRIRNQNPIRLEDTSINTHVQQQQHCGMSFHQNNHHLSSLPIPMSMKNIQQVEELTWQNGQLAMHGHGGLTIFPTAPLNPIWGSSETLESIVHQASASTSSLKQTEHHVNGIIPTNNTVSPIGMNKGSSSVDRKSVRVPQKSNSSCKKPQNMVPGMKKRGRLDSARHGTTSNDLLSYGYGNHRDEKNTKKMDRSMCASASAPFCTEDLDTTMMTWASFESPRSFENNRLFAEDDSAGGSENQDGDQENKTGNGRSHSSKRGRAAAVHNQSERRRRDRINEKMKTLQRLVPNARKMDKASMLDEVIEYLKQLQAQVHMMNTMRNINNSLPQMAMMPIGMSPQQQLQMSLLSRMQAGGVGLGLGMGMGMGMIDMNSMARATAQQQALPHQLLHPASASAFASAPQFMVQPPAHPPLTSAQASTNPGNNGSLHMQDPCFAFLAQKMNMDLYNKMTAIYRQQTTTPPSNINEAKRE